MAEKRKHKNSLVTSNDFTPWDTIEARCFDIKLQRTIRAIHREQSLNLKAPCVLYIGQAFHYTSENAFYIFNQQIYFII